MSANEDMVDTEADAVAAMAETAVTIAMTEAEETTKDEIDVLKIQHLLNLEEVICISSA
jgi:hypothetical protein